MSHPTDLELSMYADRALNETERTAVTSHLHDCPQCRRREQQLSAESAFLKQAIGTTAEVPVPALSLPNPASLAGIATALCSAAAVLWLAATIWDLLVAGSTGTVLSWFTSIYYTDSIEPAIETALFLSREGLGMFGTLLTVIACMFLLALAVYYFLPRRPPRAMAGIIVYALLAGGLFPAPAEALEIRRGIDTITVAESETIPDTLVIMGESALIEGTINGDLIAFARRVIVSGTVTGNVIAMGQNVTVTGEVGGSVLGSAGNLNIEDIDIGADFWAFAGNITMDDDSRIQGNATTFGEMSSLAGAIGRDLTTFGQFSELSGSVGEDWEAWGDRLNLLGDASVSGNLRFRTGDEDSLQQSENATVGGETEILTDPRGRRMEGNRYLTLDFYTRQLLRFAAGFVVGLGLLYIFPALRRSRLTGAGESIKSAAIGLLTLVGTPVFMILAAITIIGIPVAVIGLFGWLIAIYLAKIVTAIMIGTLLMARQATRPVAVILLAGLAVVIVAVNLPLIGGILNFLLTILGLGLLTQYVMDWLRRPAAP